ncbi:MAG TPA: hypothetical protein VHQ65_02155 [Thermoanaerobaculia bacterium]|nr:hypothetical protein [Thermoanaerobaculia bacterium]
MSSTKHLGPDLLEKLWSGEGWPVEVQREVLPHLFKLCPECSMAWQEWQPPRGGEGLPRLPDLRLPATLGRLRPEAESREAREKVKRELRALFKHPPRRRLAVIEKARAWYRHPLVVEELLARSWKAMPGKPKEAEHHAHLAYAVACRGGERTRALRALAAAHVANSLRARGDLQPADSYMKHARSLADEESVLHPRILADIDYLEAVLCLAQGRFRQAEALESRAILRFHQLGERTSLIQSLITLGAIHSAKAEPEQAFEIVSQALPLIDPIRERRLHLCARHNVALYLCDAGRFEEAEEAFRKNQPLYDRFPDDWTQLRRRWLAGRLARSRQDWREAERQLVATLEGFARKGVGYDAALACLDLAELYLAAGEKKKFRRVARGLDGALRSKDLHQEATAAVVLLRRALVDEVISKELLAHVRNYLDEARNNPALRFDPSA